MKRSLATSLVLHAAVIGFGVFSLSSPRPLDVADVDSLPVDLVSIEEFAQVMRGDRRAELAETPAPTPTERPDIVEEARNVGDNKVDLDNAPTPEPRPTPVENTASRAEPTPPPAPEPEREARAEPAPPQPAPPQPAPPPEPAPKEAVAPQPERETVSLPETAPVPVPRPNPAEPQTARATETVASTRRPRERRPDPEESTFDDDQVAALINRAKASGGGAQRSQQQAALGNRNDSSANRLSQSELDALRSQLESCWSPPIGTVGSSEFTASVKFNVDVSRRLTGAPVIVRSSGNRQFDDSVVRAVHICNDRGFRLPEGKHAVWADIVVNFDPRDMF